MPDKVKKLVRARMQKTGETYQTALRHVRAQAPTAGKMLESIMYEEAKLLEQALEGQIPGQANAVTGPGPGAAVRFYVEGTTIVLNAILSNGRIMSQAVTEPEGATLWGIKEYPLSERGARHAAADMIAWFREHLDTAAIETDLNSYSLEDIRLALHQVSKHPLRGAETSYDGVTDNGKVKDGQPLPGIRIRLAGETCRFRITEVTGDIYSWDELTMKITSFLGFINAMRDLLRGAVRSRPTQAVTEAPPPSRKLCSACTKPATIALVSDDKRETLSCDDCKHELQRTAAICRKEQPLMPGAMVWETRPVIERRL